MKLKTKPAANAHLVRLALENAQEKYGKAWHILAPGIREALVRAEAFWIIAGQMNASPMVDFAQAVNAELMARSED